MALREPSRPGLSQGQTPLPPETQGEPEREPWMRAAGKRAGQPRHTAKEEANPWDTCQALGVKVK